MTAAVSRPPVAAHTVDMLKSTYGEVLEVNHRLMFGATAQDRTSVVPALKPANEALANIGDINLTGETQSTHAVSLITKGTQQLFNISETRGLPEDIAPMLEGAKQSWTGAQTAIEKLLKAVGEDPKSQPHPREITL